MVEAVSEMAGKGAYSVRRQGSQAVESASKFACSPDRRADCALVLRQPTSARQQPLRETGRYFKMLTARAITRPRMMSDAEACMAMVSFANAPAA